MGVRGLTPLQVEDFGGLHTNLTTAVDAPILSSRRKAGGIGVVPSALDAKNLRFIPGGFLDRDGLTPAFEDAGTRKATHIAQFITQEDARKLLVVTDDGRLYIEPDSGTALDLLKGDWAPAPAIGHSATLFDREHLAVSDGRIGSGSPLLWDGINLDRMSPSGPGTSHTLALGAAGANAEGEHKVVVIFETRHGYRTPPSDEVSVTVTASNEEIDVSNIPIGPDWVSRRILAMDPAGGGSFYFTDAMILDDNTSTTLTIDVADSDLQSGTLVDHLFRRRVLPEVAGLFAYGDRMVAWGGRNTIPLSNLDFDGGFDPANPAVPAGWLAGSGTAPGSDSGSPSTPANVDASDDVRHVVAIAAGGNTGNIDMTGLGLGVPAGATVTGITVTIERNYIPTGGPPLSVVSDLTVQLLKAGAPVGDNKASALSWPLTVDAIKGYGASDDLWGTTWTPAEVNGATFGLRLNAKETGGITTASARIDHVVITVHYTTVAGGAAGGSKEEAEVYLGFAYKVTGDGAADIRGDVTYSISETLAKLYFRPGEKVKFRVRAKRTSGLTDGAIRILLDNSSPTFLLTAATLTTTHAVYESGEIAIESFPTQLTVQGDSDGSNPLTNNEAIIVDSIQIFPADSPFASSVVRVSDSADPEAFDDVRGFFQVRPDDGQKVTNCFEFRDLLFVAKERSLHVTRNDGVNPAALWEVKFVDAIGCDSVHGSVVVGEQFALLSYRDGVFAIFGLRPVDVSNEIQESPAGFPSWDDREEPQAFKNHITANLERHEAYLSVVRSGGTWPTRTFVLNWWSGWEQAARKWSYNDWNLPAPFNPTGAVTASAIVEEAGAKRTYFGAEAATLYKHTGTSDDGNAIDGPIWRSAFLDFQGDYGSSVFGALSIRGAASGSNLIIEAYEIDDTLKTLSQGGGETLTAAQLLEMQINLVNEKVSFQLRSNTLDSTLKVDAMTVFGKPYAPTRRM